jgi:hypothetical protein
VARYAVLLLLISFVVWRYLPRVRVTWFAVVALFVVIVAVRSAYAAWA